MHAGLGLLLTTAQGKGAPASRAPTMRSASMTLRMAAPGPTQPAVVNEQLARLETVSAPGHTEVGPRSEPSRPANPAVSAASVQLVEQLVVAHPDAPLPSGQLRLRALVGLNAAGQWMINTGSQTGPAATAFVRSLREGLEGLEALSVGQTRAAAQHQLCLELLFEEQHAVKVKLMTAPERCLSEACD